jgi:hypothetical protein
VWLFSALHHVSRGQCASYQAQDKGSVLSAPLACGRAIHTCLLTVGSVPAYTSVHRQQAQYCHATKTCVNAAQGCQQVHLLPSNGFCLPTENVHTLSVVGQGVEPAERALNVLDQEYATPPMPAIKRPIGQRTQYQHRLELLVQVQPTGQTLVGIGG